MKKQNNETTDILAPLNGVIMRFLVFQKKIARFYF
nr:MAG TPA: hypothetical protein [Caudoviricetes sp.]